MSEHQPRNSSPALGVLIVRADAGQDMGSGHVMRCLALAQGWMAQGGRVVFVLSSGVPLLEERLRAEGIQVLANAAVPGSLADAHALRQLAEASCATWVVVDGYHFGTEYQAAISRGPAGLLCVDDYGHAGQYTCDLVLNQNSYARETYYSDRSDHTRLLLGAEFICLRKEFWGSRGQAHVIRNPATRLLLSFGGTDSSNIGLAVVRALEAAAGAPLEVVVVAGGGNVYVPALRRAVVDSRHAVRLEHNVANMVPLFEWADIALTAGGSTCWELLFLGVPSLVAVLADNQLPLAKSLAGHGLAVDLGSANGSAPLQWLMEVRRLLADSDRRGDVSRRGRAFVDGFGVDRVLEQMRLPLTR